MVPRIVHIPECANCEARSHQTGFSHTLPHFLLTSDVGCVTCPDDMSKEVIGRLGFGNKLAGVSWQFGAELRGETSSRQTDEVLRNEIKKQFQPVILSTLEISILHRRPTITM